MLQLRGMIYWTTIAFKFHSFIKKTAHIASSGLDQLQLALHAGLTGVGCFIHLYTMMLVLGCGKQHSRSGNHAWFPWWESSMECQTGKPQCLVEILDMHPIMVLILDHGKPQAPVGNMCGMSEWENPNSSCGKYDCHVIAWECGRHAITWECEWNMGIPTAGNAKHVWNVSCCGVRNSHTLSGYGCIQGWTFYFRCIL